MVGTGPHIGEVERPEVNDRQAVGIDRAAGLLGDEVIHHAQEAGGQEEAHRVMAVPPLHHGVLHAGIGRVGLPHAHRHLGVVDDMQDGDGQDVGAEEPVGHVDVPGLALHDGAEEHDGVGHPHQRDQDVDRPFELGIFLRAGDAQRQRDDRGHDHQLPAPERERRQRATEQPRLAGALHDVVGGGEQRAAAEGEDDRIGVQRAQASEGQPRRIEIKLRPDQLCREQNAYGHTDNPPDYRHDGKLPHDAVIEGVGARIRGGDSHSDPQIG